MGENMHQQAQHFLKQLFSLIESHSVKIHDWKIDHICYRTSDENHYQEMKEVFSQFGELLAEFVANLAFDEIINQNSHLSFDQKGTQKAVNPELAVSLEEFAIKFHHQSLEQVIEFEKNTL